MRPFRYNLLKRLGSPQVSKAPFHMSRSNRWRRPKQPPARGAKEAAPKMEEKVDYSAWSQEKLIERVTQLENELKSKNARSVLNFPYYNFGILD
jgi:hypothetical protein